ncbi:MAG: hypothetical protein EXQ85_02880 [Alphaproteobacteria bacterium]|nr:hypothetical protein [Alphaproteobacteria bacterium]
MAANYTYIDTAAMAWQQEPTIKGMKSKRLHVDAATGASTMIRFVPPGFGLPAGGLFRHYHTSVIERTFYLAGDFPHWEFDDPADKVGDLVMFRRGVFMDRPPNTVHGLLNEPRSQAGAMTISWATGNGVGVDDPRYAEETVHLEENDTRRHNVAFTAPRIFAADSIPWQRHQALAAWKHKPLAAARGSAPKCSLVFVPADWSAPRPGTILSYSDERRWVFVVNGDLAITVYDGANSHRFKLKEGGYLEWYSPTTIGFSTEPVSEIGATVLCVGHALA